MFPRGRWPPSCRCSTWGCRAWFAGRAADRGVLPGYGRNGLRRPCPSGRGRGRVRARVAEAPALTCSSPLITYMTDSSQCRTLCINSRVRSCAPRGCPHSGTRKRRPGRLILPPWQTLIPWSGLCAGEHPARVHSRGPLTGEPHHYSFSANYEISTKGVTMVATAPRTALPAVRCRPRCRSSAGRGDRRHGSWN